jgi:hypothetical protein
VNSKGGDIVEGNHNVPYEMMPKNKSYIGGNSQTLAHAGNLSLKKGS